MINIVDKTKCCGCGACAQICPQKCISLVEDEEGFLYPQVTRALCVDCCSCERVCPEIEYHAPREPIEAFASINPNRRIVEKSSSGGVFSVVSERVITRNGIVFGAAFDDKWFVRHTWTACIEGLEDIRGSKYVQSRIDHSFKEVHSFLLKGKLVLFSGTPCQIAALNKYLRKEYDNLLTVEIACHGVPSPRVFQDYLGYITNHSSTNSVSRVFFRNKKKGWLHYHFIVESSINDRSKVILDTAPSKDLYMQSFLKNYSLRPSCYKCPFKEGRAYSDITLADFWGIWNVLPQYYDKLGVSAVLVNTLKGKILFDSLNLRKIAIDYSDIVKYNKCLVDSSYEPQDRDAFWSLWLKGDYDNLKKMLLPSKKFILTRIIKALFKCE